MACTETQVIAATDEHMAARHVLLDGMDLAGKSSAATGFVEQQAGEAVAWDTRYATLTPNPIYDQAREMGLSGLYDSDTVSLATAAAISADLGRYRRPEKDTLQDSALILRSLAHVTLHGSQRMIELFTDLGERHPTFDTAIVLTASHKVRLARLERHPNPSHSDTLIARRPETFFAMERLVIEAAQRYFQASVLDTSDLTEAEVVSAITELVQPAAPVRPFST